MSSVIFRVSILSYFIADFPKKNLLISLVYQFRITYICQTYKDNTSQHWLLYKLKRELH
jgi:hypothetical protein